VIEGNETVMFSGNKHWTKLEFNMVTQPLKLIRRSLKKTGKTDFTNRNYEGVKE
jgi:hypothetical protein